MKFSMKFEEFKEIFDRIVFEGSKKKFIEKLADNPDRYISLFRPTKPKAKVLQNILQSQEILFGNAFEVCLERYIHILGYKPLPKNIKFKDKLLSVDLLFEKDENIYVVEVKIRDDHDSSKKSGQIENFEKKIDAITSTYKDKKVYGLMYFIDPSLVKNKRYYQEEVEKLKQDYNLEDARILYGKELFEYLEAEPVWKEILTYLKQWKDSLPELPEINFDSEAEKSFEEIKEIEFSKFRKLFDTDLIKKEEYVSIFKVIFPEKRVLSLLEEFFDEKSKQEKKYKNLLDKLKDLKEKY